VVVLPAPGEEETPNLITEIFGKPLPPPKI
jgi:hypothetical protein